MSSHYNVTIHIEKILRDLNPTPSVCCIFKVPQELRMVKPNAYKPEMISIGPYHRNKGDHLRAMEEHKARYLQALLRRNQLTVESLVHAMREFEVRAWRSYAEPVNDISQDEFLEMLILDGCFIVELIRKFCIKKLRDPSNSIFKMEMVMYRLTRDFLLLENQLPFFVVWKLYEMTETQGNYFLDMIFEFFRVFPGVGWARENGYSDPPQEIDHLLGLLHDNWLPSRSVMKAYESSITSVERRTTMRCATELKNSGVKFKKASGSTVLFDINFVNGTLIIPKLSIGEEADSLFRNLVAYEQYSTSKTDPDHILDYVTFMDCLIDSAKDVELLFRRGIIQNSMGSDECVANLFNRIGDSVVHSRNSIYQDIVERVNSYCDRPWNRRMAKLRHYYCNSPWALISLFAALLLLSLAFAQTVYTVLSYYKYNP